MPTQLFVFVQFEFPWLLGPPDGRYLLRAAPDGEPERVIALDTLATARADLANRQAGASGMLARRSTGRRRDQQVEPEPEPEPVTITRVTVIDPVPLSAETQARAWLEELDRERDASLALRFVNRLVHSHRIAAADPYVREVALEQALVLRAGWGEGEQVAHGRWLHALELAQRSSRRGGRRRDRSWVLRPQERLAALLGGRGSMLVCEELTLRARLDLDEGRPRHAAIGLDRALRAAVGELGAERRADLALRIDELRQLSAGAAEQARQAMEDGGGAVDEELLAHTLGRLEAALRARTAPGV